MKIKLSSTLPFTPVQLDAKHELPRRAVGQLHGMDRGREYRIAVYQFRHGDDDQIHYQVNPMERVYTDDASTESGGAIDLPVATAESMQWLPHDDSFTYKPYSYLVMNAITKLVADWDGVVYRTPRGEKFRDCAKNATLQVIDACVCNKFGLWVKVTLSGEKSPNTATMSSGLVWVPL